MGPPFQGGNPPWNINQTPGQWNYQVPPTYQTPMMTPIRSRFLATLNLPDLSQLTTDPILHMNGWLTIPTKLPLDIPKFNGRTGDDSSNHVMTFHLWCSSNSLVDGSIRFRLFQWTLTGTATK